MDGWGWVVMVVFSCAALIISLYCLFFMVPVRRFWAHIRSLGGGMKGMESHLRGIEENVSERLAELERNVQEQIDKARDGALEAQERLAEEGREARRELGEVSNELKSLQEELRRTAAESDKMTQGAEKLTRQLRQMRSDFDVLDVELKDSVRQQVAKSFHSVESTVLSALEAIQDEIVFGAAGQTPPKRPSSVQPGPIKPKSGFGSGEGKRHSDGVIRSLFGDSAKTETDGGSADRAEEDEGQEAERDRTGPDSESEK